MTPMLRIDIDRHGTASVVTPRGDIDMGSSPALRDHLRRAQESRPERLVIDLSSVEYMDSSGLATLVEAMKYARTQKTRLILAALQPRVRAIFEIARLHQFFTIVPGVSEALEQG